MVAIYSLPFEDDSIGLLVVHMTSTNNISLIL